VRRTAAKGGSTTTAVAHAATDRVAAGPDHRGTSSDLPQLQWKVKLQKLKMTISFTTTVDGDTMAGKDKAGMFGSFSVLGERTEE
jgi:hypothetical protein